MCVCVFISDKAAENPSIPHLDEEINVSDVEADEKSFWRRRWTSQLIFYLATVTLTNPNWLGDQK